MEMKREREKDIRRCYGKRGDVIERKGKEMLLVRGKM